jgi:hypothetical protein
MAVILGHVSARHETCECFRYQGNDHGVESLWNRPETAMTKVETLEEEISRLTPAEFAQLRVWLLERDWEEWDRQIERDSTNGKLSRLFNEAREDHAKGNSTKL